MSTLEQDGEEVVGQARCPFESRQSNVGLFAGKCPKREHIIGFGVNLAPQKTSFVAQYGIYYLSHFICHTHINKYDGSEIFILRASPRLYKEKDKGNSSIKKTQ